MEDSKTNEVQPEVIEEIKEEPKVEDTTQTSQNTENVETIEEIKDEPSQPNQAVNMWEPELVEENNEIVNQEQNKDSQ